VSEVTHRAPAPMSLRDTPALIEVLLPAQKLSIEAQAERKATWGQTLTVLGSYWKGRKPLVLVRACILGSLLPVTDRPDEDLAIFELLMAMDDAAFIHRAKKVSKEDIEEHGGGLRDLLLDEHGAWKLRGDEKRSLLGQVLGRMPYADRLDRRSLRPEELADSAYNGIWDRVNAHLGTTAHSHAELVEQLGIMRFGHRPLVADSFCGGGSIPFEAARLGCDAHAADINPIACMLTWGAFHILGAGEEERAALRTDQVAVVAAVELELAKLGVERNERGDRAKTFLYCLEVRCPETGWWVPLAPSWIISNNHRTCARLVPDPSRKRFEIEVVTGASADEMARAKLGTTQKGYVVYQLDGQEHRIPVRTLRGDRRTSDGGTTNDLRRWGKLDVVPQPGDIFQERLYCVQWLLAGREGSYEFRSVTDSDLAREQQVLEYVNRELPGWQAAGLVPDMQIEAGKKTEEPVRERGWTHWQHLFHPRQLLCFALVQKHALAAHPGVRVKLPKLLDYGSRLCRWDAGHPGSSPQAVGTFSNQVLNTLSNYGVKSFSHLGAMLAEADPTESIRGSATISTVEAARFASPHDLGITDPPYADAVCYHEITEFFIAWLRKNPPAPFAGWVWDSRRALAIKGSGEEFRREMVRAYQALAEQMPDNGLQIVMFTHQDAAVWGDMAGIFWGAGLRVSAAWYIATETTSELKKGGYVQGTVILVLRKRTQPSRAYKDELVLDIRAEVQRQIETMIGLNQRARQGGRSENLFEDADLQMAGYAAALRVLTSCTHIDGNDMTREALRSRRAGETTLADELIAFAVTTANEFLVPDGLDPRVWEKLTGSERFYLRMLDLEAAGLTKLDNYQNFAKAFKVEAYQPLMATLQPNAARLKSAAELKHAQFSGSEFGGSVLRAVLYALLELQAEVEVEVVLGHLHDNVDAYYQRRDLVLGQTAYLAVKLERLRPDEASAARVLRDLLRNERLGA